ncbi:MAG: DUF1772 domain-containing protein [Hydrococcus sp. Prado102]|nr:DUF1772 domain-containing protein [Hydrococcus sp. Prado102]
MITSCRRRFTSYLLVGSLLYLVGTVGVTIAFNVPLNYALAIAKPDSTDGANLWSSYLTNWTFWNHIQPDLILIRAIALLKYLNPSAQLLNFRAIPNR